MEARIRSTQDEELQYRSQDIRVNGKTIVTPIKAFDHNRMDSTSNVNTTVERINELYALVSDKNIHDYTVSSNYSLIYRLNQLMKM